ncbi:hypothetical protein G3T14_14005 [Methylobacterium sp. BTF04]|uniref:hypothetical protein n=1 Tax=Methylobacterium sp. BTF04 TaxID=2708300 RepID=UPI0013D00C10|nr:hypothetical protein [Methylobacterium sp. BTF04]NEU13238.1 hypothetical protein [Methylobacterium sp. BTF04]
MRLIRHRETVPAAPFLPARDLVQAFESVGDNCEFGLVQRYCGAEPLGLFRFSSAPIANLVHALETDFSEYGGADDLEVLVAATGRLYCRSRRYGFAYNTSDFVGTTQPAAIHRREVGKVAYLKRRLLEDLAEGEKVFVRKGDAEEEPDAVAALARAVRRHGPGQLLAVRRPDREALAGTVTRHDATLMIGHIRRFAPYETAYDIDLASWLDLCRRTHALARGLPAPLSAPASPNLLAMAGLPGLAARHVLGPPGEAPNVFGRRERTDRLDADAVHVFSAWVWIPADFRGDRVGAAIGHFRHGWCDADLSVREAWQRVWVAAKIPATYRDLMMGLLVTGPAGERLWSTGRRLEAGPLPAPAPQPRALRIGLGSGT